jgi:hypothetical protein
MRVGARDAHVNHELRAAVKVDRQVEATPLQLETEAEIFQRRPAHSVQVRR